MTIQFFSFHRCNIGFGCVAFNMFSSLLFLTKKSFTHLVADRNYSCNSSEINKSPKSKRSVAIHSPTKQKKKKANNKTVQSIQQHDTKLINITSKISSAKENENKKYGKRTNQAFQSLHRQKSLWQML